MMSSADIAVHLSKWIQKNSAELSMLVAPYIVQPFAVAALFTKAQESALKAGKTLRKGVLKGPCPICGKKFESQYDKIFCSLECYNKSPQFKEMTREAVKKGSQANSEKWDKIMTRTCPVCSKEYRADRTKRKFCSQFCYRKFKADLFDAWIANPEQLTLPQCYDEFMLQEELPCLIDGCKWKGNHLSVHLNSAHGIKAEEFKRAAGFNLSTGLVSKNLFKTLSERKLTGVAANKDLQEKGKLAMPDNITRSYHSLEGKEHTKKTRMLLGQDPERMCKNCGRPFTQSTPFGKTIYCSIECRNDFYKKGRTG